MRLRIWCLSLAICVMDGGQQPAAAGPPGPGKITVIHDITYRDGPGRHWKLDLAMQNDGGAQSRPGIVVIHGGGWIEGDKSSFASREHGVPGNIIDFAALGFVAVTINYRLADEVAVPGRAGRLQVRRPLAASPRERLPPRPRSHRCFWEFGRRPPGATFGHGRERRSPRGGRTIPRILTRRASGCER